MDGLEFRAGGRRYAADLRSPVDLAIPLDFAGPQPRFFAPDAAYAEPLRAGGFTGSVAHGASCNCATYTVAPHCHGTHTECIGHLTAEPTHVVDFTPVAPALALLVSVTPEALGTGVAVDPVAPADPTDRVIRRAQLAAAAARWLAVPWSALVVRTLPNDPARRHREYAGAAPAPYFLVDAMDWIVERGVGSLVVDLPSLDRADDGGHLAAHRRYWGLPPGATSAAQARRGRALVTELAYVPDTSGDGLYLLDLHVPAWAADAAPSRPVLYALREVTA